jgi:tight adherence protein C
MKIAFLIVKILNLIFFVVSASIFLNANSKSKGVYDDYIAPLDKGEFKSKDFLPIGLYLSDAFPIRRFIGNKFSEQYYRYNGGIRSNIEELYGRKFADYYYEIHVAAKYFAGISAFLACMFLSGLCCIQNDGDSVKVFFVAAFIAGVGFPFLIDKGLNDKIAEKRLAIQIDFPEFVNKLLLLVNAGLTISKAWEKIVDDNRKDTPLYRELNFTMAEIRGGKNEALAYEEFARRCKIKEVIKCVSIIVLNLKKGGSQVVPALREQADDCWELRKSVARQQGEKASSKLMFPMGIMLLGIIMIVVLPAVLSIQGL